MSEKSETRLRTTLLQTLLQTGLEMKEVQKKVMMDHEGDPRSSISQSETPQIDMVLPQCIWGLKGLA